jgi:hypothetical protein
MIRHRYFRANDFLDGRRLLLRVSAVDWEETSRGRKDWVTRFDDDPRALVLTPMRLLAMREVLGPAANTWVGQQLWLFAAEQLVRHVRIAGAKSLPAPPPAAKRPDDKGQASRRRPRTAWPPASLPGQAMLPLWHPDGSPVMPDTPAAAPDGAADPDPDGDPDEVRL